MNLHMFHTLANEKNAGIKLKKINKTLYLWEGPKCASSNKAVYNDKIEAYPQHRHKENLLPG